MARFRGPYPIHYGSPKTPDDVFAKQSLLDELFLEARKSGFRVALDDVGSGFAGLTMLADLNPDLIKIDRDLVQGAPKSEMHRIIVRGLVQVARDSGCLILAKGVETESELELMKSFGVELFQGFLLGRPAPPFPVSAVSAESGFSKKSQELKNEERNVRQAKLSKFFRITTTLNELYCQTT